MYAPIEQINLYSCTDKYRILPFVLLKNTNIAYYQWHAAFFMQKVLSGPQMYVNASFYA